MRSDVSWAVPSVAGIVSLDVWKMRLGKDDTEDGEHVLSVCVIALLPALIGQSTNLSCAMVALVKGDGNQAFGL
jgi:hypothetical protein